MRCPNSRNLWLRAGSLYRARHGYGGNPSIQWQQSARNVHWPTAAPVTSAVQSGGVDDRALRKPKTPKELGEIAYMRLIRCIRGRSYLSA